MTDQDLCNWTITNRQSKDTNWAYMSFLTQERWSSAVDCKFNMAVAWSAIVVENHVEI